MRECKWLSFFCCKRSDATQKVHNHGVVTQDGNHSFIINYWRLCQGTDSKCFLWGSECKMEKSDEIQKMDFCL